MNIGNLYLAKTYYWLLFQTKEDAEQVERPRGSPTLNRAYAHADDDYVVANMAAYWSRQYNCEITYFSPNEYIVFLEEEGKLKKVLTSDGKLGWTWFEESYNDYFEELKAEP